MAPATAAGLAVSCDRHRQQMTSMARHTCRTASTASCQPRASAVDPPSSAHPSAASETVCNSSLYAMLSCTACIPSDDTPNTLLYHPPSRPMLLVWSSGQSRMRAGKRFFHPLEYSSPLRESSRCSSPLAKSTTRRIRTQRSLLCISGMDKAPGRFWLSLAVSHTCSGTHSRTCADIR
eukprot:327254-Rhodomonas_salina.3